MNIKNFGLVMASVWLRLRCLKGGASPRLLWHPATGTEGLSITDAHVFLPKTLLCLSSGEEGRDATKLSIKLEACYSFRSWD